MAPYARVPHSAHTERSRHERHLTGSRMVVGIRRQVVSARAVDGAARTARPGRDVGARRSSSPASPRGQTAAYGAGSTPPGCPSYGAAPYRAGRPVPAPSGYGAGIRTRTAGAAGHAEDERARRSRRSICCMCRAVLPPRRPGRHLRLRRPVPDQAVPRDAAWRRARPGGHHRGVRLARADRPGAGPRRHEQPPTTASCSSITVVLVGPAGLVDVGATPCKVCSTVSGRERWTPPDDSNQLMVGLSADADAPAGARPADAAPGRLGGRQDAAHRHLRLRRQDGLHGLRRRLRRQRAERLLLLPDRVRARGGGRRRRGRPGGHHPRGGPAGRPEPVALVRPAGDRPALPVVPGRRLQPVLALHRGPDRRRASTPGPRRTPPAASPSTCRRTSRCSSRCPTA